MRGLACPPFCGQNALFRHVKELGKVQFSFSREITYFFAVSYRVLSYSTKIFSQISHYFCTCHHNTVTLKPKNTTKIGVFINLMGMNRRLAKAGQIANVSICAFYKLKCYIQICAFKHRLRQSHKWHFWFF